MADQAQHYRRKLLKSIAVGGGVFTTTKVLPDKWTKPVVDAVALPAHAAVSPPPSCEAPPCVQLDGSTSFHWPGGVGPHNVFVHPSTDCSGTHAEDIGNGVVLAPDIDAAKELCALIDQPFVSPLDVHESVDLGECRFWVCDD